MEDPSSSFGKGLLMICIRCGKLNSSNSSKCGSCGAVLPRNYGQSDSSSLLSLEDGRNYEPPDRVYPNTAIQGLEEALRPMLAENIDTVVLGCTHYPFVIPLIQQIVGPEVRVIDPAPAVARLGWPDALAAAAPRWRA